MHSLLPYAAILNGWANPVSACDQHSFSEASHINFEIHDDSAVGDPEGRAVCTLVYLGLPFATTTSDQNSLCDVDCLSASQQLSCSTNIA